MAAFAHNRAVKKKFGQHFLRESWVTDEITSSVTLTKDTNVFEIGCGDGFLTRVILKKPIKKLWVFEIDPEWATFVQKSMPNPRMTIFQEDILQLDFERLATQGRWTLLANLPYQITFPILHLLQQNRHLLNEGVIMVQEEVAQKIMKKSGRGYGFPALFFNHYFEWKLLSKIKPEAFFPPPKVDSRLLYFKPVENPPIIKDEIQFWKFIKLCFQQPRRTLRNNLTQSHINLAQIPDQVLALRAQQMSFHDLLALWNGCTE